MDFIGKEGREALERTNSLLQHSHQVVHNTFDLVTAAAENITDELTVAVESIAESVSEDVTRLVETASYSLQSASAEFKMSAQTMRVFMAVGIVAFSAVAAVAVAALVKAGR